VTPVEVSVVRWPSEESLRRALRDSGRPRLLLVDGDVTPPRDLDELQDWIRLPADDADIAARMQVLSDRAHVREVPRPSLDPDGVLRVGRRWVALPPIEARLAAALVDRGGRVVSRSALAAAGWPDGAPARNALDVHILRLRRRLITVGLAVRTVRSRGYLLEPDPAAP
jgi:DNA-binding response OmpR family regulator